MFALTVTWPDGRSHTVRFPTRDKAEREAGWWHAYYPLNLVVVAP